MNHVTAPAPACQPAPLALDVPGWPQAIPLAPIAAAGQVPPDLLEPLRASAGPTANLTGWSRHPDAEATAAAEACVLLASEIPNLRFRIDDETFGRPFDAAVAALIGGGDTAASARSRRVATYLASQLPADEHELAANLIADRLRARGVKGLRTAEILRQVRKMAASLAHPEAAAGGLVTVAESLPGLKGSVPDGELDGLVVPAGYRLGRDGVFRVAPGLNGKAVEELVTPTPFYVSLRTIDLETRKVCLEIVWLGSDRWETITSERRTLYDRKSVTELAAYGPFVDSNNAAEVIRYLGAFEAANERTLRTETVTSALGWAGGDPHRGFVLPDRHVRTAGGTNDAMRVRAADAGGGQLLAAVRASGSFDGWKAAVAALADRPVARLVLLAALAPPLLAVLGRPNFLVSLSCPTSRGKTTCQRVAASVWGRCGEDAPTLVFTFNATRTWVERAAASLAHLPLILDDTTKERTAKDVQNLIYDLDGVGRGRGTRGGLAASASFRTVGTLSGETSLGDFTQAGGARARVLQLPLTPLGDVTPETGRLADALVASVGEHHGHAGPAFVQYIVDRSADWPAWRDRRREIQDRLAGGDGGPALRVAGHAAVLELAGELAAAAGVLPFADGRNAVGELWPTLLAGAQDADRAAAAAQVVLDYAAANPGLFPDGSPSGLGPDRDLAGRRNRGPAEAWALAIIPTRLRQILSEAGFAAEGTVAAWREKGWLASNGGKNDRCKVRMRTGEPPLWTVALTRAAVEAVQGPEDEPPPRNVAIGGRPGSAAAAPASE